MSWVVTAIVMIPLLMLELGTHAWFARRSQRRAPLEK